MQANETDKTFRFARPVPGTALGSATTADGVPIGWVRKNSSGRWTSYGLDGRRVYAWHRTRRAAAEQLAAIHARAEEFVALAPNAARQAEIDALQAHRAEIDTRLAEIDAEIAVLQGR